MNDAMNNAKAKIENIVELYNEFNDLQDEDYDEIQDRLDSMVLSVEIRSGWSTDPSNFIAEEFRILLTFGGPGCQIIGTLDRGEPEGFASICFCDWGTPWTPLTLDDNEQAALDWFVTNFYFGN